MTVELAFENVTNVLSNSFNMSTSIVKSNVTNINGSCLIHMKELSLTRMHESCLTHVNESCHTHMNEPCHTNKSVPLLRFVVNTLWLNI